MSDLNTVMELTEDAYSKGRYASWSSVAKMLLKSYSPQEAAAIMLSKWTRWAADASDRPHGKVPAKALRDFMSDPRNQCDRAAVADLVKTTF